MIVHHHLTRTLRCLLGTVLLLSSNPAAAWSNHALATWQALSAMAELRGAQPVKAERLETFLEAQREALDRVLQEEEDWARANVPEYPARPDALAFRASGTMAELRQHFVRAVRINPEVKLKLFVQVRPGEPAVGKPALAWTDVTTLRRETTAREINFIELAEGDSVAVEDVLATASDEPDYGMDIGLWDNNDTGYGKIYGFGRQPFGNPALEFASQAPLHMGFYHEAAIVYLAAGFLKRTYPEYRIHLWRRLADHALRNGHFYWGWRFAGWALHYLQDLSQPYHARVLPGISVPRMLWINSIDLLGFREPKNHAITLVSNRHLALENYQYHRMRDAYRRRATDDALLQACRDGSRDSSYPPYGSGSPRQVVSRESHAAADAADRALERSVPPRLISDPNYVFNEGGAAVNLFEALDRSSPAGGQELAAVVSDLLRHLGAHTRSLVRGLIPSAGVRPSS